MRAFRHRSWCDGSQVIFFDWYHGGHCVMRDLIIVCVWSSRQLNLSHREWPRYLMDWYEKKNWRFGRSGQKDSYMFVVWVLALCGHKCVWWRFLLCVFCHMIVKDCGADSRAEQIRYCVSYGCIVVRDCLVRRWVSWGFVMWKRPLGTRGRGLLIILFHCFDEFLYFSYICFFCNVKCYSIIVSGSHSIKHSIFS